MFCHLPHHVGVSAERGGVSIENGPVFLEFVRGGQGVEDRFEEVHLLGEARRDPSLFEVGQESPADLEALLGGEAAGVVQETARIGSQEKFLIASFLGFVERLEVIPGFPGLVMAEVGDLQPRFQQE